MNFPAHAWVSHAAGVDDPERLLGTMLPDLAELGGVKFDTESLSPAVQHGRLLHHALDAAFHDHDAFRTAVGDLRRVLRDAGLATGPRRAAAHVGYELLLDATLDWSPRAAVAFDTALHAGQAVHPIGDDGARHRWSDLVSRLRAVDVPSRSSTTSELARRVELIVGRRPRLALADGDVAAVAAALDAAEPSVRATSPALLDDLAGWLRRRIAA